MRKAEDILADYAEACKHDEMRVKPGYERVYEYANIELRESLRKEYVETLPANKQLAIYMHGKLCNVNHTDMCSFYYEIDGIVDNWDGYAHKEYLKKANAAIQAVSETAHNIVVKEKAVDIIKAVLDAVK